MLILFQNLILQSLPELDNGDIISIITAGLSIVLTIGLFLFERQNRKNQIKNEKNTDHTYELIREFKTCQSEYPNGITNWNDFVHNYKYGRQLRQHHFTGYKTLYNDLENQNYTN